MKMKTDKHKIDSEIQERNGYSKTAPCVDGLSTNQTPTEIAPSTTTTSDAGICPKDPMASLKLEKLLEMENVLNSMTVFDISFGSYAFPERGLLSENQVDYMIAQFRNCIKSFVTDNQTPFIHTLLYQEKMSDVYQDALGVCSLVR